MPSSSWPEGDQGGNIGSKVICAQRFMPGDCQCVFVPSLVLLVLLPLLGVLPTLLLRPCPPLIDNKKLLL